MTDVTYNEMEVLKYLAGDKTANVIVPGAAFNACTEFLNEMGYVTRVGKVTDKGQQLLENAND